MPAKDERPATKDFALAVGRLVLQCARLEHELSYHTAGLINATDCEKGYRELKGQPATAVLKKFEKLIEDRTPAGHNSLREQLFCIASDARHLFERRNALVHSIWVPRVGLPYEVLKWDGRRRGHKGQVETAVFEATEVAELNSKAENLREQLTLAMHYAFTNCSGLFETRP